MRGYCVFINVEDIDVSRTAYCLSSCVYCPCCVPVTVLVVYYLLSLLCTVYCPCCVLFTVLVVCRLLPLLCTVDKRARLLQRFIMLLSEHLVRCDTDGRDFNTHWYRWTVGRLQQIFMLVSAIPALYVYGSNSISK